MRRALFDNQMAEWIARNVSLINGYKEEEKNTLESVRRANALTACPAEFTSGYGYDDDLMEVGVALKYKKEISVGFDPTSDSLYLYQLAIEKVSDFLSAEETTPATVVNFGVCYAYTDSILARKFPQTQFVGVDRSMLTKALNEAEFADLPNIKFVASDINALLKNQKFHNGCLLHMRTAIYLPKQFVGDLYKLAAGAGIKKVVCIEPIGLSRQTFKPYHFSDEDQPSVVLRGRLLIHNYTGLLREAGFEIQSAELIKMAHPHPDVKTLCITASI